MKLGFSRNIFGKYSNTKFHENLSSGSRNVPCGRMDGNFVNTPKNAEEVQISVTNGEVRHNLPSLIIYVVRDDTTFLVHDNNKADNGHRQLYRKTRYYYCPPTGTKCTTHMICVASGNPRERNIGPETHKFMAPGRL